MRDLPIEEAARHEWEALVIPGGWPDGGYNEIYQEPVLSIIQRTWERDGIIATSCTGIFPVGEAGLLRGRRATTFVSPGGCAFCSENKDRLAAYGAIVCNGPMVADQRIFSDIGPGVCTSTALELFRAFIGESGVSRLQ